VTVSDEHAAEQLARGLHRALRPAKLLRPKRGHVFGQLGGRHDVRPVHETPTHELRAIRKVQVLGERVVLPATGFVDGSTAPDATRAGEVEHAARAEARAVLHEVMAVQHQRLNAREQTVPAVDVPPAGLHHAALRIGEVADHVAQEIGLRHEVRIEDGDQLALCAGEAVIERAGFVTRTVGAAHVHGVHARFTQLENLRFCNRGGFVAGVVEHLNLETVTRVVDATSCIQQTGHDRGLVVERQLHGDFGELTLADVDRLGGLEQALAVTSTQPNQVCTVHAIGTEDEQNREVEDD